MEWGLPLVKNMVLNSYYLTKKSKKTKNFNLF